MKRGSFVTLHGIDGTGKTSTAMHLVEQLTATGKKATLFDNLPADSDTVSLTGNLLADSIAKKESQSKRIKAANELGLVVVKDRWLIDVLADGWCRDEILKIDSYDVGKPDLSILLTCADSERFRRINERGNPTPEDMIPKLPGTRAYAFEEFLVNNIALLSRSCIRIDTTELQPGQVVGQIAGAVNLVNE